jgi:putative ABC transport system substrate-binding protein
MQRREFITLLGGAAAVWPMAARAQQRAMPVIGFVSAASRRGGYERSLSAFLKGLNETAGYVDGHNVAIEYRWAEGRIGQLPSLVADLVQRKVNVIAAPTTPAALAAKAATATIPIVFTTIADPVQIGLVASLNRPGGNVTGVTLLAVEVGPKLLELLHDVVPRATIMALLVNPTNPNVETQSRTLQVAALKLGLQVHVVNASTERDFDAVFAKLHELRADALMIGQDVLFNTQSGQLASLSVRHAMPAIYVAREFAAAGGLMSYGTNESEAYRQAGIYAGRILKGEKPAELPVQQPTKFELVINLKTAKALGLSIPESFLLLADEVIE